MDINNMTADELRAELKAHGVSLHHKTGEDKLRATLRQVVDGTFAAPGEDAPKEAEEVEVVEEKSQEEIKKALNIKVLTPAEHLKRLTKEQRALRLIRVVVSPNDTLMSSYNGLIFTAGSSAVNKGRMIKKYVPFNNENGWHIPNIIYEQIEAAQMQKFRQVKLPNGEKGLEAYLTKKFNVQILDPLTPEEMGDLAAAQVSRGDA